MGANSWRGSALAVVCLGLAGCMATPDARYVYQDGQFGVIGIPRNTSMGKKDYREQAHELMIRHFPEGYEVVRAEEVVEGERTLDTARKIELDSEPAVAALNQMIKVGKFAKSESLDQKDSLKITESRIIYRRKADGKPTGHDGFAKLTDVTPEFYIDPNQEVRKALKEGLFLVKKDAAAAKLDEKKLADAQANKAGKSDPSVQKADHSESK